MSGQNWKVLLLTAIFLTMLAASTFVSAKLTVVLGLLFSVGGISYALTFPCVDIVTEAYGRRSGVRFVMVGLVAHVLSLGVMWIALALPAWPVWGGEAAYRSTFGLVPKFAAAGVIAYIVAQVVNVYAFEAVREMTRGRHLWLRSVGSTAVAQVIDTAIFVPLAFAGALSETRDLLFLAIGHLVIKLVIAVAATPFVYAGVFWLGEARRPSRAAARGGVEFASVAAVPERAAAEQPLERAGT